MESNLPPGITQEMLDDEEETLKVEPKEVEYESD